MPSSALLDLDRVDPDHFRVASLDDEIRTDSLCAELLQAVCAELVERRGRSRLEAGELCRGADQFLRDFVIAGCRENLFHIPAERVRQFAGHWYIVHTLEPHGAELALILAGVAACYEVFAGHRLVPQELAEAIAASCADLPFYRQRIDDFWTIEGDGYLRWQAACPLPEGCR